MPDLSLYSIQFFQEPESPTAFVSLLRHSIKNINYYSLCSSAVNPNTSIRKETTGQRSPDKIGREVTITAYFYNGFSCWSFGLISVLMMDSFCRWEENSSHPSSTQRTPLPSVAKMSLAAHSTIARSLFGRKSAIEHAFGTEWSRDWMIENFFDSEGSHLFIVRKLNCYSILLDTSLGSYHTSQASDQQYHA